MRLRRAVGRLPLVVGERPPTDFELLRAIWERHRDEYEGYVDGAVNSRETKILVPIDIPAIADEFGVDVHSVFGRLYYHLDRLYGEDEDAAKGRPRKSFFALKAGTAANCINFPLLEAVLAGLWQSRDRDRRTFWVAVLSLGIAIGSLLVALT